MPVIDVLVCDADEAADTTCAVAENMVRVAMSSVDTWHEHPETKRLAQAVELFTPCLRPGGVGQ